MLRNLSINKFTLISIICILNCILLIIFAVISHYHRTHFKLTNQYTWVWVQGNETLILDSSHKKIIGPGLITLWAKYPWIYGVCAKKSTRYYKGYYFAINILTNKITRSPHCDSCSREYKDSIKSVSEYALNNGSALSNLFKKYNFKLEKTVTFFDIADGHQWQRKNKKLKLLKILKTSTYQ